MLEMLFKSKTVVRLLALLLFEGELHIREIARRIDAAPIQVKKELEALAKIGLVKNQQKGNLSLWQLNRQSPLYSDVKALLLKTDCLAGYLSHILALPKVRFAFIYGSFASGEENARSDIDLFLVGEAEEEGLLRALIKAEADTGREIQYLLWSEKGTKEKILAHGSFVSQLAKGKKIWLKGDENEFKQFVKGAKGS